MKRILFSSTIAATLLCSTSHILAADYDYGVVTKSPAETYTDVEFGSGWYLRGDITFNSRGRSESTVTGIGHSSDEFNLQADYDDVIGGRVGFGYQFNDYLRFDATAAGSLKSEFKGIRQQAFGGQTTIEYIDPSTGGSGTEIVYFNSAGKVLDTRNGNYQPDTITPITGTDQVEASYTESHFIASGYLDLPITDSFVPYVGAGAGFGRINYNETRQLTCMPDDASSCGFPPGANGAQTEITLTRDEEFWAFAYQFSAGTAIKITDRTSLDVGYSYLNLAGGDNLSYDNGLAINEDGFAIHQGHVGIRYDIN